MSIKRNEQLDVADEIKEKLSPENTVEEMNAIIGSEGELVDEKYNKYNFRGDKKWKKISL